MKLKKGHPKYDEYFAKYMRTKEGTALSLYIMSQFVEEIEVGKNDRIVNVVINADNPIVLDVE